MENKSNETINAHIRNALTPIVNLVSLLEDHTLDDKTKKRLFQNNVQSVKNSIELLKALGTESIEPEDSMYFKLLEKFNNDYYQ